MPALWRCGFLWASVREKCSGSVDKMSVCVARLLVSDFENLPSWQHNCFPGLASGCQAHTESRGSMKLPWGMLSSVKRLAGPGTVSGDYCARLPEGQSPLSAWVGLVCLDHLLLSPTSSLLASGSSVQYFHWLEKKDFVKPSLWFIFCVT